MDKLSLKYNILDEKDLLLMLYRDSTAWFQSFEERPGRSITRSHVYEYRDDLIELIKTHLGIDINRTHEELVERNKKLRELKQKEEG